MFSVGEEEPIIGSGNQSDGMRLTFSLKEREYSSIQ